MATVLLIIHIMIALALIGVVLLQRSEGGALGIGGGGGGFMTGRGAANLLTRVTAGLAAAFFATSLLLSLVATRAGAPRSILDAPASLPARQPGQSAPQSQKPPSGSQMPQIKLEDLPGGQTPDEPPRVPQSK
jgi:preprotein translocase subunit SecG